MDWSPSTARLLGGRLSAFRARPAELAAPILVVLTILITVVVLPNLYAGPSLYALGMQAAILGLVALGQMLTMLVRGIDLSVNAVMALGAVLVVESGSGSPIILSVAFAFGLAIAIGAANGWLVTRRRVPPFIATLAMLIFVDGARLTYARGQASGLVPAFLSELATRGIAFIPWAVIICIAMGLLWSFVLRRTVLGRWIFATGSNSDAARLSGVPVERVVVFVYIASSTVALMAGLILSGYLTYVDQHLADGYNLQSITAAVVGGTSFVGGRGTPFATLAGVIFVVLVFGVVVVAGFPVQLRFVVEGLVLIGALALQRIRLPQTRVRAVNA